MKVKDSGTENDILSIVDLLGSGVLVAVAEKPVYANNELARMFGFDHPDDILKLSSYYDLVAEHEHERIRKFAKVRSIGGDVPEEYEYQGLRADGSQFQVSNRAVSIIWQGKPATLANVTDISDIKKAEDALLYNEERFRDFAELGADWFWEQDKDFRFVYISKHSDQLSPRKGDELLGFTRWGAVGVDPDKDTKWSKHREGMLARRPFNNFQFEYHTPSGEIIYRNVSGKPFFDKNNTFLGYRGVASDNKENILFGTKLLESEERFRAAFQSNHGIASITDFGTGEYIDVNDTWLKQLGYEEHEVIGKTSVGLKIWESEYRQEVVNELNLRGKLHNHETFVFTKSGEIRDLVINAELLTVRGKELLFISGSDVTDRNRFEKQLRRSQKMEAIGQLTGGIAHDFNNILGIVLGNLEIIQRLPSGDSRITGRMEVAKKAVERGAEITRKLLGFSRRGSHKVQLADLNKSVDNLRDILTKSLTVTIDVNTDLADELWMVEIDPGDFEDAILNLALNARDAMPDGGQLTIKTENKVLDKDFVEQYPHAATGNFVSVSLTDTGAGMADTVRDRIFEPFFTTKEVGKGTGLGLSMVYGFVKRSGGFMTLDTEEDNGATFHLFFPRALKKETDLEEPELTTDNLPQGFEKILIVDDEEGLLDIASFSLEELGYKTVVAEDGPSALKLLEQDPDIDLLFSDAVMPNSMSVYELAHTAHKNYPRLKILLTSGFDGKLGEIKNSEVPFLIRLSKTRLKKPYAISELATAIRQELDEAL